MKRLERQIKNRHNAPRLCPICTPNPIPMPGTLQYDVGLIPFPIDSATLQRAHWRILRAVTTPETDSQHARTQDFIRQMQREEKEALGYIPSGGAEGLTILAKKGQVAIVTNRHRIVSFAAWTLGHGSLNVQQICTVDSERRCHHARELLRELSRRYPTLPQTANVRADLIANEFWNAEGFVIESTREHKTSRNLINHWTRSCLTQSSTEPSTARITTA